MLSAIAGGGSSPSKNERFTKIRQWSVFSDCFRSVSNFFETESGISLDIPKNSIIIPGFADVHVHFREPGFFYKENHKNGHGGSGSRRIYGSMHNAEP